MKPEQNAVEPATIAGPVQVIVRGSRQRKGSWTIVETQIPLHTAPDLSSALAQIDAALVQIRGTVARAMHDDLAPSDDLTKDLPDMRTLTAQRQAALNERADRGISDELTGLEDL